MISVICELIYPHPIASDTITRPMGSGSVKHRCHVMKMIEFPSDMFLYSNNDRLKKYLSERLGPILDVTLLYDQYAYIEKIVITTKRSLSPEVIDSINDIKDCDNCKDP